jgi:hypothetical protein
MPVKKVIPPPIDLAKVDAKLRAWCEKYDTPKKVAAAHRKVLLDRVVESLAFEGQTVSMAQLKTLLKQKEKNSSS